MEAERFSGGTPPVAPSGNRYQCSPISEMCESGGGGGGRGRAEGEGERGVGKEREGGGRGAGKREGGETQVHFLCTLETFDLMNFSPSQHWLQLHPYKGHKVQLIIRADMLIHGEILGGHLLRYEGRRDTQGKF